MRDGVSASGSKRETIKRLWKSYFADPSQWWDYRLFKRNPKAPDFQHKATKDKLWLDGTRNPSWVLPLLAKKDKECPCPPSFAPPTPMLEKNKKEKATTCSITEQSKKINNSFIVGEVCDWHALSIEDTIHALEKGLFSEPTIETLVYIVKKCKKKKDRDYILRLLAYLQRNGLDSHKDLGNLVVSMLVEVESMGHARVIFDKLALRGEYSWNALIMGYASSGESQQAIDLYKLMRRDSRLHPSGYVFVALLKVC
ncbi:hypothetical protein GOP47_0028529 [Adiantum capillus-veneris]|nr:hypothetical protein GOP47_0028529 [Adiantum capillus-veneris]